MADASKPTGTWFLTLRSGITHNEWGQMERISFTIAQKGDGTFVVNNPVAGTTIWTDPANILDVSKLKSKLIDIDPASITWDPTSQMLFFSRRNLPPDSNPIWQWFRGKVVDGILVGRFASGRLKNDTDPLPPAPADLTLYQDHVTGWNQQYVDGGTIYPRVFEIHCTKPDGDGLSGHGVLRIDINSGDRDHGPFWAGTVKMYKDESLQYDLDQITWDGTSLSFVVQDPQWKEGFRGVIDPTTIPVVPSIFGDYTHTDGNGKLVGKYPWDGQRKQVLTYGLASKSTAERDAWQQVMRTRLMHLTMGGNPSPLGVPGVSFSSMAPIAPNQVPTQRDDDYQNHPQLYKLQEVFFQVSIPNPYGSMPIPRAGHGILALPDPPLEQPGPAILTLNGHKGSAHRMMDPNGGHGSAAPYWYGDAFARRGFVVLAVDISHRNDAPLNADYTGGDDPGHGNGPHPSIKAAGFTTSDWEQTGERAWDVMQAFEFLIGRKEVDPQRVLVTGLSMGAETSAIMTALEPRAAMAIVGSGPSDYSVYAHLHSADHSCWRWLNADILEYVDISDYYCLIAPRPFVLETGKKDDTYSHFDPHYAGDKQVARRIRVAYGSDVDKFVHYLHYDGHAYHVGDINPLVSPADEQQKLGVRVPTLIQPASGTDVLWQKDGNTALEVLTNHSEKEFGLTYSMLFDFVDNFI